jgi:GNAT superfamily N-acetyltransferase
MNHRIDHGEPSGIIGKISNHQIIDLRLSHPTSWPECGVGSDFTELRRTGKGGMNRALPRQMQSYSLFVYVCIHYLYITRNFCQAWITQNSNPSVMGRPTKAYMSQANEQAVEIYPLEGDDTSIQQAAGFMVKAFWLGNPLVQQSSGSLSESAQADLVTEQAFDFTKKYGERMGRRLLDAALLAAVDSQSRDMLGLVSLETCLLDRSKEDFLTAAISEDILKNAVASLGPKQRREYKDSSAREIAEELLPAEQEAVCCLSNLAVSPSARRRGIAMKLCLDAEKLAKEEGFDVLYLKVEKANEPACKLYQGKLGFEQVYANQNAAAVRVDLSEGRFVETQADTLILAKQL